MVELQRLGGIPHDVGHLRGVIGRIQKEGIYFLIRRRDVDYLANRWICGNRSLGVDQNRLAFKEIEAMPD